MTEIKQLECYSKERGKHDVPKCLYINFSYFQERGKHDVPKCLYINFGYFQERGKHIESLRVIIFYNMMLAKCLYKFQLL